MTIREELRGALTNVLSNASNYPVKVQARLLGQDMGPLTERVTDTALAVFEQAHTPTDPTWPRTNDYFTPPLTDGQMEQVQQCINDPLRAQAYTPTDAQPRKVPHTGPGHASGDAGFCEGCLAERDQNKRGPECIPGEPFTLEDLAREHDNLAAHPTQMSQTIPAFHTLTAKALRWAAGFRRTAVQEPQAEPQEADADPDTAFELGRVAGYDEAMREVQAEPTDAQVIEAVAAWRKANRFMSIENAMRAALRAALQEGENQ